jgi:alpha-tubulin suppressor-like RCC1 family protein
VYVCGYNRYGQLGVGHRKYVLTPQKMKLKLTNDEIIKNVIFNNHAVFIWTNKEVYVCGYNGYGKLGVGHENDVLTPTKIKLNLAKDEIVKNIIFCNYSTFIQTNRKVYVCGNNNCGQLGVGHAKTVFNLEKIKLNFTKGENLEQITSKDDFTFANNFKM